MIRVSFFVSHSLYLLFSHSLPCVSFSFSFDILILIPSFSISLVNVTVLHLIVCVLQHGRCKHWNTVFSCLAFDSSLGFPGEGPLKILTDFFARVLTQSADKESSNEPSACCNEAAEPILTQIAPPLPPRELELHEVEMAYAEEVLCNHLVSGKGVRERKPDKQGR